MPRLTLKRARRSIPLTQPELAAAAGEKVSAIHDIEAKRSRNPAYARVVRIFRALKCKGLDPAVTIDDIFPVVDPPACQPNGSGNGKGNGRRAA